jgi:hypothetical protein
MSFYASYFDTTCTLTRYGARDGWGNRTADYTVTLDCLAESSKAMVQTASGTLVRAKAEFHVGPDADVAIDDSIDWDGTTYTVVKIVRIDDFSDTDAIHIYAT